MSAGAGEALLVAILAAFVVGMVLDLQAEWAQGLALCTRYSRGPVLG